MGLLPSQSEVWFNYPILVQPHHTDYAGVVWHGSYVAWLEEARIAALGQVGIAFADLVAMGCDLPVIEIHLNYRKALQMEQRVRVRSRLKAVERVRLIWIQNVCALEPEQLCYVTGRVVNVPVDRQQQKILRTFPPLLEKAIAGLTHSPTAP
jgi:acyl-CoA thioester hydrolase